MTYIYFVIYDNILASFADVLINMEFIYTIIYATFALNNTMRYNTGSAFSGIL